MLRPEETGRVRAMPKVSQTQAMKPMTVQPGLSQLVCFPEFLQFKFLFKRGILPFQSGCTIVAKIF